MSITFDHTTLRQRVLFGTGLAVQHAQLALAELGAERILLIAGAGADDVADGISSRPIVGRISTVVQHVPEENAVAAVKLAQQTSADAVVTIGGGSATGLGKVVARDTGVPIVAIPTTFAGSEATNVWGETRAGRKVTGVDDNVLPRVIVYDAALSSTLPARLAMASGLNAVAHAVDGFWAPLANPINAATGSEGLRALVRGLRGLVADAHDLDARERTLYGAYLSAVSFASAGSGMHHKICHVLGGAYALPHAEMHAVVLPHVTAFNAPGAPEAAARISDALGGRPAARGLSMLREEVGVVASLRELGLAEQDLEEAADLAFAAIPSSNPRPFGRDDVFSIIRAAWAGEAVAA